MLGCLAYDPSTPYCRSSSACSVYQNSDSDCQIYGLGASMRAGVSQGRSFDDRSNSRPARRTITEASRGPLIIALTWQARAFTRPTRRHSTRPRQIRIPNCNWRIGMPPQTRFLILYSRPRFRGSIYAVHVLRNHKQSPHPSSSALLNSSVDGRTISRDERSCQAWQTVRLRRGHEMDGEILSPTRQRYYQECR